uniref:Longin domain-containing protein n=1 Tax=Panagrolaimus sp. PS1159 TaxID=55785 RepID=A0AC35G861_9BILA
MKLYSILLFQKFQDGQKPKLLKEVHDLKELSFFQKGPFKESAELAGQLLAEKAGTSSLTREKWGGDASESGYFIHCCINKDNLAGICITDADYHQYAFKMLTKIMEDFSNTISPSSWNTIKDSTSCNYSKLPEFLKKWQNPCEADSQNDEYDEILKEIRRINEYDEILKEIR